MEHLQRLRFSNFGKLKTNCSSTPYVRTFKTVDGVFQSQYRVNGRLKHLNKCCKLYRWSFLLLYWVLPILCQYFVSYFNDVQGLNCEVQWYFFTFRGLFYDGRMPINTNAYKY